MRFSILPALAALLLSGCAGYKLGPAQPTYMAGIHSIAVPSFKNSTLIPRLEVPVANIVIKQFQQDGTYQIASESNADAVLNGTIVNIKRQSARSLRGNVLKSTEYNLIVTLDVTLTNRLTGKVVSHRQFTGMTEFFVSGDIQQDEQQAIPLAVEKAAVDMVSVLSEGF